MSVSAIAFPRLPSWLFGIGVGRSFGKRGMRPVLLALKIIDDSTQLCDFLAEHGALSLQGLDFRKLSLDDSEETVLIHDLIIGHFTAKK